MANLKKLIDMHTEDGKIDYKELLKDIKEEITNPAIEKNFWKTERKFKREMKKMQKSSNDDYENDEDEFDNIENEIQKFLDENSDSNNDNDYDNDETIKLIDEALEDLDRNPNTYIEFDERSKEHYNPVTNETVVLEENQNDNDNQNDNQNKKMSVFEKIKQSEDNQFFADNGFAPYQIEDAKEYMDHLLGDKEGSVTPEDALKITYNAIQKIAYKEAEAESTPNTTQNNIPNSNDFGNVKPTQQNNIVLKDGVTESFEEMNKDIF